ncbi:MAG: hypothetical protein OEU50_24535 [Gammaproteobacteria bacterium]|nr:hypothetical protein [Gammaproteobacteria bacterium]
MKLFRIALITAALLLAGNANAGDWDFGVGVSYVTGISDVVDLYEDNFEIEESDDVETFTIPIGASFVARFQAESGITVNIGVGPAFIIAGDVEHTEIPLSATIGYMFSREGDTSPYIRIGIVDHSVSGDYVESSDSGMLTAIGVEFGRNQGLNWGIELSVDDSSVEFEDFTKSGNTEIDTYDRQLTLFFLF